MLEIVTRVHNYREPRTKHGIEAQRELGPADAAT